MGAQSDRNCDPHYKDRWQIDIQDLGCLDVMNERIAREGSDHEDEPMYLYDFCIIAWVQFDQDGPERRAAVLRLAQAMAQVYPVVVTYNGEVLATFAPAVR